jgi:hypothetical protein
VLASSAALLTTFLSNLSERDFDDLYLSQASSGFFRSGSMMSGVV